MSAWLDGYFIAFWTWLMVLLAILNVSELFGWLAFFDSILVSS
jgi:hypothetical protein